MKKDQSLTKFFKPEDFEHPLFSDKYTLTINEAVNRANAKLERESKVVYGSNSRLWTTDPQLPIDRPDLNIKYEGPSHKAFLINIELIEQCTHPKENVQSVWGKDGCGDPIMHFECEICSARVQPKGFEGVK